MPENDALTQSTSNNDPDFRGALSPFKFEIQRGAVNKSINSNIFSISDYRWYPYGLEEYFNDDYFNNATFEQTDGGLFTGITLSDISSVGGVVDVANKTVGYAKNQFEGVIDSIGGLFEKDDVPPVQTSDSENKLIDHLNSVPKIRLYEFQPNNTISEMGALLKDAFKFFDDFFKDSEGRGQKLDNIKTMFSSDGVNDILQKVTGYTYKELTSPIGGVKKVPNFFYRNLIGGFYTAQYDLPFLNQPDYLHGMGSTGWESRSLKQRLFPGGLSGIMDKFSDIASSFDIASKPKWNMDGSGPSSDEITFEMMLFNTKSDDLLKNIKLIHSLVGGNMWIQNNFKQLSPSLYDIEVVGRYRYYFCKADVKVDFVGKSRRPPVSVIGELNRNSEGSYISINSNAFGYVPDAYRVTITFQSLIPNNFNTYLNYLSDDVNLITVGDERESIGIKFVSSLMDIANETADQNATADQQGRRDETPLGA